MNMTSLSCKEIIDSAINHLKNEFRTSVLGDDCIIVTPFLNADSAPVEIYARQAGNKLFLSDEGEALSQLFVIGVSVEGNKELTRQVGLIAQSNNVQFRNSELFVETSPDKIGYAVQRLATAIQATSFLVYKRAH